MKTFKTITFVTATTAVVSVITLFSVEQTKNEKKFFDDDSIKSGFIEEKDATGNVNASRDTFSISSKDTTQILTGLKPSRSDPDNLQDTSGKEGLIGR